MRPIGKCLTGDLRSYRAGRARNTDHFILDLLSISGLSRLNHLPAEEVFNIDVADLGQIPVIAQPLLERMEHSLL